MSSRRLASIQLPCQIEQANLKQQIEHQANLKQHISPCSPGHESSMPEQTAKCDSYSEEPTRKVNLFGHGKVWYLSCNWLSRFGVVEVSSNVKLQQLTKFPDDVLRSTILILPLQLAV